MSILTISFFNSLLLFRKPVEELPLALESYLADARNYGVIFWKVSFQFRERLASVEGQDVPPATRHHAELRLTHNWLPFTELFSVELVIWQGLDLFPEVSVLTLKWCHERRFKDPEG